MITGNVTLNNDTTVTQLTGQLFLVMADGTQRLVAEGETLAQGAVVCSLNSTTFIGNGQLFELVNIEGLVTKNSQHEQHVTAQNEDITSALPKAMSNTIFEEIATLHKDILKGLDPTANFVATAAGGGVGGVVGASGSGNGGYVTIERDGDAVIASAGFDTSHQSEQFLPRDSGGPIDIDDLAEPEISVNAPDNTTDTTPTITGTTDAKPGSTVTIIVTDSKGNEQELTTTVKPDGSYSVDVEKPLPEGDYKAEASVTDPAGNTATDTDDGSVDLTAPQITVDAPDNTPDTTPTITGTTDVAPGSTVTIVVTDSKGNEQTLTTTVKPDGSYSVDVETPLTEGDYTADATVTDPAGNKGEATDPGSVDITPPDLGIALDPNITPDDIINAKEAGEQIPVSGVVSGE
ncbi:MAG: retention module-containing protein, partial [Aeromonas sp.]